MELLEELKIKTETYYAVQKSRVQAELRIGAYVRDERLDQERSEALMFWLNESLKKLETVIMKDVSLMLKDVPIWTEWLKGVYGIGPCLAGSLIAGMVDINRFETISALWHYCGMHVVDGEAPRRKRGSKITWNPFLRMTIFKTTDSFVKQNAEKCQYRELYDTKKKFYQIKFPDEVKIPGTKGQKDRVKYSKGHIHNMAKRYAGKIFLAHLWVKWRELEGLPISDPWVIAHGGHTGMIQPRAA